MIRCSLLTGFDIAPGTRADALSLAPSHYRAGPPATIELVLAARTRATRELAGVLVISRPVLNASWRAVAWPEHFGVGSTFPLMSMAERARIVNEFVRCISRVIIDQRHRGVGLSTALVRAYLREPLTPLTEGIAAMAGACPFFEAAGLRRVPRPPASRERELINRLRELRVPARLLLEPEAINATRLGESRAAAVERALRRWMNDSRASRGKCDAAFELIAPIAGSAILSDRAAFVHGSLSHAATMCAAPPSDCSHAMTTN
ncbi:MAG: hypothetical protein K2X32_01130 [Phycisphaerales bacterium]|nr:hypothetical protein [Phycisphaerales bacterium]